MTNNPIKAIVWDLDGTIIHFKIDYIRARRAAIKILKKYGISKNKLSIHKSIFENVNTSKDIFKSMGFSPQKIEKILKKINGEVTKIEREAANLATMINEIDQVLEFAKKVNLKQVIYTLNNSKNAKISLSKVNLSHYFNFIVGRDNVKNPKPHPDHLLYICNNLNVDPSEILVIGDSARDIEGAKNIGARSIAIKTKISRPIDFEVFQKADRIIEEDEIPSKLIEAIKDFSRF
ncbi:MAG: HAD family hydrolase [Promethearchaeota archaeon]